MNVPQSYSEWLVCIDALKNGGYDDEVLLCMKQGTLSWTQGVAERFVKQFSDMLNYRMNAASDRFSRSMNNAHGGEAAIVGALIAVRKELSFLYKVTQLPAIPDTYRQQYMSQILQQANKTQESLEQSAKADKTGRLSSIVRNNKVNKI